MPYIVDFRSAGNEVTIRFQIPTRQVLRAKSFGSRVFFSLWRPVRTASALSGSLIRCSAPKMEDAIIRARVGVDEFASSVTTLRISYDNIMVLRVNRPSTTL